MSPACACIVWLSSEVFLHLNVPSDFPSGTKTLAVYGLPSDLSAPMVLELLADLFFSASRLSPPSSSSSSSRPPLPSRTTSPARRLSPASTPLPPSSCPAPGGGAEDTGGLAAGGGGGADEFGFLALYDPLMPPSASSSSALSVDQSGLYSGNQSGVPHSRASSYALHPPRSSSIADGLLMADAYSYSSYTTRSAATPSATTSTTAASRTSSSNFPLLPPSCNEDIFSWCLSQAISTTTASANPRRHPSSSGTVRCKSPSSTRGQAYSDGSTGTTSTGSKGGGVRTSSSDFYTRAGGPGAEAFGSGGNAYYTTSLSASCVGITSLDLLFSAAEGAYNNDNPHLHTDYGMGHSNSLGYLNPTTNPVGNLPTSSCSLSTTSSSAFSLGGSLSSSSISHPSSSHSKRLGGFSSQDRGKAKIRSASAGGGGGGVWGGSVAHFLGGAGQGGGGGFSSSAGSGSIGSSRLSAATTTSTHTGGGGGASVLGSFLLADLSKEVGGMGGGGGGSGSAGREEERRMSSSALVRFETEEDARRFWLVFSTGMCQVSGKRFSSSILNGVVTLSCRCMYTSDEDGLQSCPCSGLHGHVEAILVPTMQTAIRVS